MKCHVYGAVRTLQSDDVHELCSVASEFDYPFYLACVSLEAKQQQLCWLFLAFMAEMEHIIFSVREPLAGHVRFAWWREQLDKPVSAGHPLCAWVNEIAKDYSNNLRIHLRGVIEGYVHILELQDTLLMDDVALCAEQIYVPLLRVLCSQTPDSLLIRFARAHGLQRLWLRTGVWMKMDRHFIPHLLIAEANIEPAHIRQGNLSRDALVSLANAMLHEVRKCEPEPCTSAYPIILKRLRQVDGVVLQWCERMPMYMWSCEHAALYAKLPLALVLCRIKSFFLRK